MRRVLFLMLALACTTGPALAKNLDVEVMVQPESPIRVVGCAVDLHELRNGQNFSARGSFEDVGPKTATAVRIGFAFFDALGERRLYSGLTTGTYTPGARIDVHPFGGQVGTETRKLVCFALQAGFSDGTTWKATRYPTMNQIDAPPAGGPIPVEITPQATAPVHFDSCAVAAPADGFMQTALQLTNLSAKVVRRVDVDFTLDDGAGGNGLFYEWMTGNYAAGAVISGSTRLRSNVTYVKVTCSIRRIDFADGTSWPTPP